MNRDHLAWHTPQREQAAGKRAYPGELFLNFHFNILTAHRAWRSLFHIPPVAGENPSFARPSYLTTIGGTAKSPIYEYVRLGECASLDEAGEITVRPWHNAGHEALGLAGSDMGSLAVAVRSANNLFWRWHGVVDEVRADWAPDKAQVVAMQVVDRRTVRVTFDRPVSFAAPAANNAQLNKTHLTAGNRQASNVTTTDHMTFTFTIAIPLQRPVTLTLAGTRGFADSSVELGN